MTRRLAAPTKCACVAREFPGLACVCPSFAVAGDDELDASFAEFWRVVGDGLDDFDGDDVRALARADVGKRLGAASLDELEARIAGAICALLQQRRKATS